MMNIQNWFIEKRRLFSRLSDANEPLNALMMEAVRTSGRHIPVYTALQLEYSQLPTRRTENIKSKLLSFNQNIRDTYSGINELQICYQHRTTLVKDKRCDVSMGPDKI
jgi:hypothetical protein